MLLKPVSRWMFWLGVALTLASLISQFFLAYLLFGVLGHTEALSVALGIIGPLNVTALGIGVAFIAFSLVARAIEVPTQEAPSGVPPRLSFRQLLWGGVVLTIVGILLMASLDHWLMDLRGNRSVALDLLNIVGPALKVVCFPLGTMLIPASIVVRTIETRRASEAASAYQAGSHRTTVI